MLMISMKIRIQRCEALRHVCAYRLYVFLKKLGIIVPMHMQH